LLGNTVIKKHIMKSIIIADSHPIICYGIRKLLELEVGSDTFYCVKTLDEALVKTIELQSNLLIMDFDIPHKNPIDVIQRVRKDSEKTKILIFTGNVNPNNLVGLMRIGGVG